MIKSLMTAVLGTRFDRERKRLEDIIRLRIVLEEAGCDDLSQSATRASSSAG